MSRTSAAQTSESEVQPTVAIREDGSVICKHKVPRGRCNKLLVAPNGHMLCPNGHKVDLVEALCASVNAPDATREKLLQLWPIGWELRPLIRRLGSPEFTNGSGDSWQRNFLIQRNDVLAAMLVHADHVEPETAAALREFWEKELRQIWPDVAAALANLKALGDPLYYLLRERAIQAFQRNGPVDPLRHMVASDISLTAIKLVRGQSLRRTPLYEHNVKEATRFLQERRRFPSPALLYFHSYGVVTGEGCGYHFSLVPDPHFTDPGWQGWDQISISLHREKSFGKVLRVSTYITHEGFRSRFHQVLSQRFKRTTDREDISYTYDNGKINVILPEGSPIDFESPQFHLDLVKKVAAKMSLRMSSLTDGVDE